MFSVKSGFLVRFALTNLNASSKWITIDFAINTQVLFEHFEIHQSVNTYNIISSLIEREKRINCGRETQTVREKRERNKCEENQQLIEWLTKTFKRNEERNFQSIGISQCFRLNGFCVCIWFTNDVRMNKENMYGASIQLSLLLYLKCFNWFFCIFYQMRVECVRWQIVFAIRSIFRMIALCM